MNSQVPVRGVDQHIQNISFNKVLSANVSIGQVLSYDSSGVPATFTQDNGNGIMVRVATTSNPFALDDSWAGDNVDTVITHNLGRIPIGYYVTKKTGSCDVFDGSAPPDASTITLQNTNGSTVDTVVYIF